MAIFVPTAGENELLRKLLKVDEDIVFKLFVNDVTPGDSTSYTEMSTHGYTAPTVAKTAWTIVQESSIAVATAPEISWPATGSFTAAAAVNVYGYFAVGAISAVVLFADRFAAVKVVTGPTTPIRIIPRFSLNSKP